MVETGNEKTGPSVTIDSEGLRRFLRDRKLGLSAQACVDSAVWDAFGKAVGQPLYRLWGGAKEHLPVIAIAGYYEEGKSLTDFAREMQVFLQKRRDPAHKERPAGIAAEIHHAQEP